MDADRLGGGDAVKPRVSTDEVLPAFGLNVRLVDGVGGIVEMNALVHSLAEYASS
jgi:hypothetical protein